MDKNNLSVTGAAIVALITALIGPIVVEYVKSKFNNNKKKDPIKSELEHSRVIDEELEDIRTLLEADRCWISMFHNGGYYLHSSKSMKKFSIMFENSAPGVSGVSMLFNNLPVSLFSKSIEEIVKNKKIYIPDYNDPTVATFGMKGSAEASGTISSYSIALLDIATDRCIGILGIDYLKKNKLNHSELSILNEKAQRIAGFLSNFINDHR